MKYLLLLLNIFYSCSVSANYDVIDGDSLENEYERVRLQGIDAPEYPQICWNAYEEEYPCGVKSLEFLKSLINNQKVDCVCEAKPDRYGRKLCECFVGDTNLNKEMIRNGWALRYRTSKYKEDEQYAKEHLLGLWQGKFMRPALQRTLYRKNNK